MAREVEVAFPVEMSREEQVECLRSYVQDNFVSQGMCADWAIHDKGNGNPHAHILLTVRGFDENGKWISKQKSVFALDENGQRIPQIDPKTGQQKVRKRELWVRVSVPSNDWNEWKKAEEWRASWADHCNRYLKPEAKIDHRSYERQGVEMEPTIHEGFAARQMEARGAVSDKCQYNREVKKRNNLRILLKEKIQELSKALAEQRNCWNATGRAERMQSTRTTGVGRHPSGRS